MRLAAAARAIGAVGVLSSWGAVGAWLGACDTGVHAVPLGLLDASPECEPLRGHSDLATIQTLVFDKNCASTSGCHKTSIDDSAHLALVDGMSWAALVNQKAQSTVAVANPHGDGSPWLRVVPGDPDASYLMALLDPTKNSLSYGQSDPDGGVAGPLDPSYGSMPTSSGGQLLCPEKLAAVRAWIEAGAPDQ